jgi:hypothetical protein
MAANFHVIKFNRVEFVVNWELLPVVPINDQVFIYQSTTNKIALIEVLFQLPTGNAEAAIIETLGETIAYVHRDVIHVQGTMRVIALKDVNKP